MIDILNTCTIYTDIFVEYKYITLRTRRADDDDDDEDDDDEDDDDEGNDVDDWATMTVVMMNVDDER